MSQECYKTLEKHREFMDIMVDALIDKETIGGQVKFSSLTSVRIGELTYLIKRMNSRMRPPA